MSLFVKWITVLALIASLLGSLAAECPVEVPTPGPAQAKCVSKTQFILMFQDIDIDPPLDCPSGTVCANVAEICSATADPVCPNTVVGTDGRCNECDPAETTTPKNVCVNTTAFAFCIKGKLSTTMVYPCPADKPYCKVVDLSSTCIRVQKELDCPLNGGDGENGGGDPTPTPTPTPTPFTCKEAGFFANTSDKTCKGYYKCQMNTSGGFDKFSYSCTQSGYAFDPVKKSCVLATSFTCPNA